MLMCGTISCGKGGGNQERRRCNQTKATWFTKAAQRQKTSLQPQVPYGYHRNNSPTIPRSTHSTAIFSYNFSLNMYDKNIGRYITPYGILYGTLTPTRGFTSGPAPRPRSLWHFERAVPKHQSGHCEGVTFLGFFSVGYNNYHGNPKTYIFRGLYGK